MLHKTLAAETETTTDRGLFRALVSTGAPDREGDVVMPGAFAETIKRWRASGKMLPLAWDHSTKAEDLIGIIDPRQMEETGDGLIVGGKVDLESARGREAWRALKSGSIGFSIGFLAQRSRPRRGKGRDLLQLDLFEISATATPMVFESRVLDTKAAEPGVAAETRALLTGAPSAAALEARAKAVGIETRPLRVANFEC